MGMYLKLKMEKHYTKIFITVIGVKLLLAWFFPVISDEVYWYTLGQHLDGNYYDHPPMTGWVIYAFSSLGSHIFYCRLFPLLCGIIVALGILLFVQRVYHDPVKAKLVSLLFLVAPLNILFVPMLPDTALFLFIFLSGMFFCYGIHREKGAHIFISGIFLGLAVLCKYFSGLLLIAVVFSLICHPEKKRAIRYFLIFLAGAVPFVVLHLYWNYTHCWTNIMFNVINRNRNIRIDYAGFMSYIGFQFYLATPWCLFYLGRHRKKLKEDIKRYKNLFFWLYLIPIIIFGIVSFQETGLHWYIAFYPFFFMLMVYLKKDELVKAIKYTALFSLIHIIPVFVVLSLPVETFKNHEYYHDLVLCTHGDELAEEIEEKYGGNYILGTNGYYTSGALNYFSEKNVIVFHDDSKFGREDDKVTDFRELDGKNILILSTLDIKDDYSIYFDRLTFDSITIRENRFNIVLGEGFNYRIYHDRFLTKALEKWYDIPDYLPVGDCFFYNKYFPERYNK